MSNKNGFLTFLLSFIPGAGQMYQGFLRRGTSLMLAFSGGIAVIAYFRLEILIFLLPVLWFFSFFDSINLRGLPLEQRQRLGDKALFVGEGQTWAEVRALIARRHALVGGACIFAGLYIILILYVVPILRGLGVPHWVMRLIDNIPTLLLALLLAAFGLCLVRGGSRPAAEAGEDLVEFGGDENGENVQ